MSFPYSNFIPGEKSISERAGRRPITKPIKIMKTDSFPEVQDCRILSISAENSALKMHKSSQSSKQYTSSLTQNNLRVAWILKEIGTEYHRIHATRKKNFCHWANFFWVVRPIFVCSRYRCWVGSRVEKKHEKVTYFCFEVSSMYVWTHSDAKRSQ